MASTALATMSPEAQNFELQQRKARMFAMSPLVPDHLRKGTPEQGIANCYIALTLADVMRENALIVMQNIHFISGKAGFSSKYMIARANASGKFKDDLDWEITGQGKTLSATCFATLASTGKRVEMTVDMAMAEAEHWTRNAKYKSMPELMLRYRSASFLINLYAPEVMLGYRTVEEIEDIGVAAVADVVPLTRAMLEQQAEDADVEPVEEGVDTLAPDSPNAEEGPADEQRGEALAPEWAEPLDVHLARVGAAENVIDLNAAISDFTVWLDDLPEDERARVMAAERDASDRLNIAAAG